VVGITLVVKLGDVAAGEVVAVTVLGVVEAEDVAEYRAEGVPDEVVTPGGLYPFAAALKVSKSPAGGLIAKTIPKVQWRVQWNHKGTEASFTVVDHSGEFAPKMMPESIPLAFLAHGLSNVDWVTV